MGCVQLQHEMHASLTRKMSGQNQDTLQQANALSVPNTKVSLTIPSRFTFFYFYISLSLPPTSTFLFLEIFQNENLHHPSLTPQILVTIPIGSQACEATL